MLIVDITGFGNDETKKMQTIRYEIQRFFTFYFGSDLQDTTVNFFVDPSVTSSLKTHTSARIYTKRLIRVSDTDRDTVCERVYGLLEEHGKHIYNEAFTPGYKSMRGRQNPNFKKDD